MDYFARVTLFRHGITEENIEKKYVGWSDPPITAEAAKRLARLQKKMPVYDFYVSSDLARCRQTAELIAAKTPGWTDKAWREMYFGEWELNTYEDLKHHSDYRNWLDDPFTEGPPGGEKFTNFKQRVTNGWMELKEHINQKQDNRVLVVTHGGVIRLLLTLLADPRKHFWEWKVPHGRGIELIWSKREWEEECTCTLLQEVPITENANG